MKYKPASSVLLSLLAALCLAMGACGGDKAMGEPCGGPSDCADHQCVAGIDGDEPVCTRSCASGDDCPEGWSCAGATEDMVLVCIKGGATPFGM